MKRIAIAILCLITASVGMVRSALALTYQTTVGVDFTINPSLTVTLSSADLLIESLTPGSSANSNEITVTVTTNAAYGYTLSATTGSASNATRNLVPESGSANFASIDFYNADVKGSQTSLPDNTSDTNSGTWGFSVDSGSHYNGLPLYTDTTNVATLLKGTSMPASGSDSTQFLIGAKASSTQAVGEYTNVVNFVAVAQANWQASEVACPANYICYVPNADNGAIEGSMNYIATYSGDTTSKKGYQSASNNTSVTLVASNYKREGYGFAGWNTAYDYSGTTYGPMQTITAPSTQSSKGLTLYAVWVESAGYLQDWNGCSSLTQTTYNSSTGTLTADLNNSITALTDKRDGNTYAVARLADGNCWMIENLRLDSEYSLDSSKAQGYGSNTTYGNFVGLPSSEDSYFDGSTTANSLYYSGTQSGTASYNIGTGGNPGYRFPRYNNNTNIGGTNASGTALTPSYNANNNHVQWYSYGNYYTWPAAMANTTYYTSGYNTSNTAEQYNSDLANTSICPSGWRLPYGNSSGKGNTSKGFYYLANTMGATSSNATSSNKFRMFPNNFLYSGDYYSSSAYNRGSDGYYWSSSANSYYSAYNLGLYSSDLNPGTNYNSKYIGFTVRCVAGS